MTTTIPASTIDELTEKATRLVFECSTLALAGSDRSDLLLKAGAAVTAAMQVGASFTDIHLQAKYRLIKYLLDCEIPGHVSTLALDGDIDNPTNSLGERVHVGQVAA